MDDMSNAVAAKTLESLDNHSFTRQHVKTILVSGVGFLSDQYDLQSINILTTLIGYVFYPTTDTIPSIPQPSCPPPLLLVPLLVNLSSVSAKITDTKRMYGIELMIIIVGTLGAALASNTPGGVSVVSILCFWRVFQGLGIGADYPMSATIVLNSQTRAEKRYDDGRRLLYARFRYHWCLHRLHHLLVHFPRCY